MSHTLRAPTRGTTAQSVGAVHVEDDGGAVTGAFSAEFDALAQQLEATRRTLEAVRSECSSDRRELLESIASELRDIRVSGVRGRSVTEQLQREVRQLQAKINAATVARLDKALTADKRLSLSPTAAGATGVAERTLHELLRESQKSLAATQACIGEVELLKATVTHDRVARNERQREQDAEDRLLEQKLREAEERQEALANRIARVQQQNKVLLNQLSQFAQQVLVKDVPTRETHRQMMSTQRELSGRVAELRESNVKLVGCVESLERFAEVNGAKYESATASLNERLLFLERLQKAREGGQYNKMFQPTSVLTALSSLRQLGDPDGGEASHPRDALPPDARRWGDTTGGSTSSSHAGAMDPKATATRQRLERFYAIYNPSKLDSVGAILEEYAGAEEELFAALEMHYGAFGYFSCH